MLQDIARPILEHLVIPFHMQDFASLSPFLPKKTLPKSIDMSCSPKKNQPKSSQIIPNHPKSSQIIPNHIIEICFSTYFNFGPFSHPRSRPRLCRGSPARSSAGAAWKGPATQRPTGRRSPVIRWKWGSKIGIMGSIWDNGILIGTNIGPNICPILVLILGPNGLDGI